MAGIFANVESDITKLKQLKAQIEEVKKALKSIDVNTDIGKGMEAQLKGLLSQYDTLVNKIAEAEAKVKLSVANINKAMETISRQPPKTTGTKPSSKPETGDEDEARRAKIVEQAYKDLNSVIRENATEFDKQVTKWNEASNAIRIYGEEIKKIKAEQKSRGTDFTEVEAQRMGTLNAAIEANRQKRNEASREMRNQIKIYQAADGSLNQLRAQLEMLKRAYADMTDIGSDEAKQLLTTLQQTSARVSEIEQSMGVYGRNVGNYASAFNGLGMSVQQIVRELPSATMGLNMFFLAISNNLPILTDEIKRARDMNEQLKKSGQSTVPVWKQLVSSIFSWQTAMMLAITAFSMYGKEIAAWVKNLFNAGNSLENLVDIQKEMNDVMSKGTKDAQGDVTRLNLLYNATQDVTRSTKERATAVEELQKKYPDYFGNMSKEEILAGKAADSYTRLSQAIIASARARAAQDKMTENASKILDNEQKINEAYKKLEPLQNKLEEAEKRLSAAEFAAQQSANSLSTSGTKAISSSGNVSVQNAKSIRDELKRQVEDIEDEIAGYRTAIRETNKLQQELAKSINIESLVFDPSGTGSEQNESVDRLENYLNDLIKLRQDNEDRQIELMQDGTEKEVAEIKLRYSRIRDEVKALESDLMKEQGGKLTKEQLITFSTAYSTIDMRESQDIGKTDGTEKRLRKEREAMNKYLQEYGTYQEKRLSITQEYQQKIAEATTEGDRMTLQKQMEEALSNLDIEALKTTSAISQLFGDMTDKTLAELERINKEGSAALEFLKGGQWDEGKGVSFGITKEQFDTISKTPEKLQAISKALRENKEAAEELRPAYEKVADGLRKIFNAGGDSKKINEALEDIQEGLGQIMQAGSFLSDTFSSLGDAFGSKSLSGVSEGINTAMDALSAGMQGAQAGSLFGPIGAAAGAAIGVVTSLASSIAKIHDKKNEKRIQALQDQIDTLTSTYDKLGRAVEDAYSKDASGLIEDQNKLLEQQKVLIQQQIREEEEKKNTDEERIKQWKEQLEEINQTIEDNKEAAVDAIFGEDVQSAIENFVDAYADAWTNGENRATAAKDTVKNMMKQMVTESIKAAIQSSGKMEQIRQKLQEFYADNVLTGWEQDYIYNMAEQLQNELDKQFGWADSLFKDEDTAKQQQSSRGYGITASQDSVDEMNGRLTAMAESNYRIEDATQQQTLAITDIKGSIAGLTAQVQANYNVGDEVRTILAQSYIELQGINENTGAIVKPIQQMQKDIEEVKRNTSRL